jgi:hypothetical protein
MNDRMQYRPSATDVFLMPTIQDNRRGASGFLASPRDVGCAGVG